MAQPVEYLKIDPKTQHMLDHTTTEFGDDKFWPLSGKPCFHVFLVKSQLKPLYHLVLPVKIQSMLPCSTVPVVLTYCGKKWEMIYYGEKSAKRFNWKEFAIDNGLKFIKWATQGATLPCCLQFYNLEGGILENLFSSPEVYVSVS
ncbi:B3 domain-containing protein Os04g0386900 [Camellia lanceoleosa]|uniref:B3 domain-containing protein Os04g0386900 n=1 Tax=Camellia lanceoleosa TaxID=1840588 RepID=A0ACC0I9I9_9ERIC|nr:B3 domain-containing protein Os04g0386900 [Camellia lanceoleosa]